MTCMSPGRLALMISVAVAAGALWPGTLLVAAHAGALVAGIWIVRALEPSPTD